MPCFVLPFGALLRAFVRHTSIQCFVLHTSTLRVVLVSTIATARKIMKVTLFSRGGSKTNKGYGGFSIMVILACECGGVMEQIAKGGGWWWFLQGCFSGCECPLFYEDPTTEWWTLPIFAFDPTRREHRVKPLTAWMEFISPSFGREGRKPRELDYNSSITLRRSPLSSCSIHVLS